MKNIIILRILGLSLLITVLVQMFPQQIASRYIGFTMFITCGGFFVTNQFLNRIKNKQPFALTDMILKILTAIALPMVGMILLVISFASLFAPFYLTRIDEQIAAAIGFVSNFYELQHGGWGTEISLANIFFHLTPLAITVQLVFFWSVLLKLATLYKKGNLPRLKALLFLVSSFLLFIGLCMTLYHLLIAHAHSRDVLIMTTSSLLPFFAGAITALMYDNLPLPRIFWKSNRNFAVIHLCVCLLLLLLSNWVFQPVSSKTYLIGLFATTLLSLYGLLCWSVMNTQKANVQLQNSLLVYGYVCYLFFYPITLVLSARIPYFLALSIATILTLGLALGYLIIKKQVSKIGIPTTPHKKETIWVKWTSLFTIICLLFLTGFKMNRAPKLNPITTATAVDHLQESLVNLTKTYEEVNHLLSERLNTTWTSITKGLPFSLDIAVYSPKYDQTYSYTNNQESRIFYTASIAKVAILTELLHQKDVAGLSEANRAATQSMITYSSNEEATNLLTQELGSMTAMNPLFEKLAMTDSIASEEAWGLTVTSARDQIKLLQAIFDAGNPYLSKEAKTYAQELMGSVSEEQVWGITAGFEHTYVKNGWLPDEGEWIVNSIGCVSPTEDPMDGYLIAILTNGSETMGEAQQLIERTALATKEILAPQ